MERSLTVILPVQNAQSTLSDTVTEVLDAVSDLTTDRFEVLIVDDGSRDATSEVAHDLCRRYPQVRAVRHDQPLGHEAAVRTGLERSSGDVVLARQRDQMTLERVHRPSRPTRPNYLGRLKQFAWGE